MATSSPPSSPPSSLEDQGRSTELGPQVVPSAQVPKLEMDISAGNISISPNLPYYAIPLDMDVDLHSSPSDCGDSFYSTSIGLPAAISYRTSIPWTLSNGEKKSYDRIFQTWDQLSTGFFQGSLAPEAFSYSGLSAEDLANIWGLVDIHDRGALNRVEFRLAMGLIYRRIHGMSVPDQLPPEFLQELSSGSATVFAPTNLSDVMGSEFLTEVFPVEPEIAMEDIDHSKASDTIQPSVHFQSEMNKAEEELARLDHEIRLLTEALDSQTLSSSRPSPPPPGPSPPPRKPPSLPRLPLPKSLPPLPLSDSPILPALPRGNLDGDLDALENRVDELLNKLDQFSLEQSPKDEDTGRDEGRRLLKERLVILLTEELSNMKERMKSQESTNTNAQLSRQILPRTPKPPPTPPPISPPGTLPPPPPSPPLPPLVCSPPPRPAPSAHISATPTKRRPPPPPPSHPPSIAVTDLIEAIKAGKKLRPTSTVVKRGTFPTGKVLEDGNAAAAPVTDFDTDFDIPTSATRSSGTHPPHPPMFSPVTPSSTDGFHLRAIEAGKQLRSTKTMVNSGSFSLGKVLEDESWNGVPSTPSLLGRGSGSSVPVAGASRSSLLQDIRAGRELQPAVMVVKGGVCPLGRVSQDGDVAGHTRADSDLNVTLDIQPRVSLSYPPVPTAETAASTSNVLDDDSDSEYVIV
ncbi:hypothetical protein CPB84DRAFT_1829315 [Gymnopilus junonius]|uniref:Actin cytoskeleton-regulatory complex protein pan1 n=1 Tax=Gymnopilus junonius TaxID=109634 RepID=A0A9P5TGX7_GYMJU|nr:hypothetical protein CPB84DRAFT_1829315 [Gymnopilus junonius]